MELRQIRCFLAVVQAGGFGPAADDLMVTRSALSKQIQSLERELKAELFLRGGGLRAVTLTEAGEAFLPAALAALTALEDGRQQVEGVSGLARGRIDVMLARGFEGWSGWPDIVPILRDTFPNYTLRVREGTSNERILDAVVAGITDLAALPVVKTPRRAGLVFEHMYSGRLFVALPHGHRLARKARIQVKELERENWLLSPFQQALVAEVGVELGPPHQLQFDAPSPLVARELIMAGEGICLVAERDLPFWEPTLTRPLADPLSTYSIVLVYRTGTVSNGTRITLEYMRQRFPR